MEIRTSPGGAPISIFTTCDYRPADFPAISIDHLSQSIPHIFIALFIFSPALLAMAFDEKYAGINISKNIGMMLMTPKTISMVFCVDTIILYSDMAFFTYKTFAFSISSALKSFKVDKNNCIATGSSELRGALLFIMST